MTGHSRWRSRRTILMSAVVALACAVGLSARRAEANPVTLKGDVYLDSAGGDFPDYEGPIDELVYFLSGVGLPAARADALETVGQLGTHGGLVIDRPPVPSPLDAGRPYDLSTHATFSFGQAIEEGFPENGRAYYIAGDFRFDAGTAVLQTAPYEGLTGRAPFLFSGSLTGYDTVTGAVLFEDTLRGHGVGQVTLYPASPSFFDYHYSLTSPVPEPGTLPLWIGALGFLALCWGVPRAVPYV